MFAAWSNECFEIWYMLHYNYYTSALSRKEYKDKLNENFRKDDRKKVYKKNDKTIYEFLKEKQEKAIKFAEKLLCEHHKNNIPNHKKNPATTVYKLVKRLNEFIN
ncbi:MAG: RloB family protein [Endomicrobium sp.]|jgi:hypothetical protein|nr:RloB family protein [Endomicrobium sp.]